MRIAQVSPLVETVPPERYGGTERVVSWLTEELVRRGHEVTLFAAGSSRTSATLVPVVPCALRQGEQRYDTVTWQPVEEALVEARADEFDIIHSHIDEFADAMLSRGVITPVVTTLHGRLDRDDVQQLLANDRMAAVSISYAQRDPVPSAWWAPPRVEEARVTLPYVGLDDVERRTVLQFSPRPTQITASTAAWTVDLDPQQSLTLDLTTHCQVGAHAVPTRRYADELPKATRRLQKAQARACVIDSSNEQFNAWINQSIADLYLMLTPKDTGPYPYAGIPWFCTAFGRDGLITALQTLWVDPAIAKGVLMYLAHMQASVVDAEKDSEPGKILHETRTGEMAATGEIPFGLYYGSVDATPLFLMLLGAYHDRTNDTALVEQLWPAAEHALAWMDQYGDRDDDGFLEYESATAGGLRHQGWKDSDDAVFHADGRLAEGPIAMCEVQGYAYAARCAVAKLAGRLGHAALAEQQVARAASLRDQFDQQFWCDEIGTYALALDGDKRPCKVRSSNAGQCLFTGIAAPRRARQVADQLLGEAFFTGWGVRTVATSEARYNPMSYHKGSVWPHDTALIALGFSRYGLRDAAAQLLTGLFDASAFVDLSRLPELFCGFPRRPGEGPTRYPLACAPQTSASASVFLLLQACLGLTIEGEECRVRCSWPILPPAIDEVRIRNLAVGKGQVDLTFRRYDHDVSMSIARREDRRSCGLA